MKRRTLTLGGVAAAAAWPVTGLRASEPAELRVAEQFGIAYLPYVVMRKQGLIEKHAARHGLPALKVRWLQFGGGSGMNDAIVSGNLDFAASGIPAFITLWNKARGASAVRVAAGLNNIPVFLNSTNPKVRTLQDFGDADKIALPAVKVSLQAIVLQMAAAKAWGAEHYARLDRLTVSMRHTDAMIAMLSGKAEITAHFAAPPYMFQELETPGVRLVVNSADVLGPHSFNVVYTSERFRAASPLAYRAFLDALGESMAVINADKAAAAKLYVESTGTKPDQLAGIEKIVNDPRVEFTTVPSGMARFADFMHGVGSIARKPADWRELCFPEAAATKGS